LEFLIRNPCPFFVSKLFITLEYDFDRGSFFTRASRGQVVHLKRILSCLRIFLIVVLSLSAADASDQWLIKAREEGQVVLYTSFNQADLVKLINPFLKKYPGVRVDVIRGVASSLVPRIAPESKAGKSADLVFTKAEYLDLLKSQRLLERYKSSEEKIPGDGYIAGVWVSVHGIAYNSRWVRPDQVPKQYGDLVDPRWKGKMVVNLTNFMWSYGMLKLYGKDKGMAFLKNLAIQKPRAERSSSLPAQLIAAGEFEVGVSLNTNIVSAMKTKGAPIDWARIKDPLFADLQAIGLLTNGRNPNAARLFVDYILSKEGQSAIAETGRNVVREDVPSSDEVDSKKLQIIGPEGRLEADKYQSLMFELFAK
jgi:iron(III) transport system substrate-binding protein